jgi:hypothetical protein
MYFRSLSPISLLRKTLSKDVLVLILSELEFLHPMCSCPTFFFHFAFLSPPPVHVCPSRVLVRSAMRLCVSFACYPRVDSYPSLLGSFSITHITRTNVQKMLQATNRSDILEERVPLEKTMSVGLVDPVSTTEHFLEA